LNPKTKSRFIGGKDNGGPKHGQDLRAPF